jgi:hypothetical protein
MNIRHTLAFSIFSSLIVATSALAAPMGFAGSTMVMGEFEPGAQKGFINYALTPRDALGVGGFRMRMDEGPALRKYLEANYTRLIKRWNQPHSQANIWFIGGVGAYQAGPEPDRTMVSPGLSVDWESTRLYFSASKRLYRADDVNHDVKALRAGFSFYEVNYDEIQPWFVLEAQKMNGFSEGTEITPMLRFLHRRFFAEFGLTEKKKIRSSLMINF